jgi:hypothetical protein
MPLAHPIADADSPTSAAAVPPDQPTPNSEIRARSEDAPAAEAERGPDSTKAAGAQERENEALPVPPAPSSMARGLAEAEQTPLSTPSSETAQAADPAQRPLLASEALMDDLAPVEPSREAARVWCAALGLSFALFGALPLLDLRAGGIRAAVPSLVIGAIAMVAALPGITYRQRAIAMVVLGLLSDIVGLQGTGVGGVGWNLARLVPAIALGAALMFRARYRAYTGARVFLGVALASSVPFVVQTGIGLMNGVGVGQIGAIIALVAIAASFSGFMGAETTGAGPYLAHGVALAFAVELVSGALAAPNAHHDFATVTQVLIPGLAFVGSSVLSALGLFQIVAWRFAADARRINLHSPRVEASALHDSGMDWSTRE